MARTKATDFKTTKKSNSKKASSSAKKAAPVPSVLKIIRNDNALAEYADAINGRHEEAARKMAELTCGTNNLNEFASGYLYFGLHKTEASWWATSTDGRKVPAMP